ncbi:MAG: hypothetical protein AAF717_16690 [Bacteroidota bacterium]
MTATQHPIWYKVCDKTIELREDIQQVIAKESSVDLDVMTDVKRI